MGPANTEWMCFSANQEGNEVEKYCNPKTGHLRDDPPGAKGNIEHEMEEPDAGI